MIVIDTLIGFLKDFGNNVFPLMLSLIFFCGLSAILGWWHGYDSGHRAGYEDGRTYGYNFRELELQQERNRIRLQEEKQERGYPCTECNKTACTERCQVWAYCKYAEIKAEQAAKGKQDETQKAEKT